MTNKLDKTADELNVHIDNLCQSLRLFNFTVPATLMLPSGTTLSWGRMKGEYVLHVNDNTLLVNATRTTRVVAAGRLCELIDILLVRERAQIADAEDACDDVRAAITYVEKLGKNR